MNHGNGYSSDSSGTSSSAGSLEYFYPDPVYYEHSDTESSGILSDIPSSSAYSSSLSSRSQSLSTSLSSLTESSEEDEPILNYNVPFPSRYEAPWMYPGFQATPPSLYALCRKAINIFNISLPADFYPPLEDF